MRKTYLSILPALLLASCAAGDLSSSAQPSSSEQSSSASQHSTESESSSSAETPDETSSSEQLEDVIFEKTFEGYKDDSLPFFMDGYSTVNSKFGDNYLNLIDPEGYMRTCDIPGLDGAVKIELYCHVTNLNNLTSSAVGQSFAFTVSTIDYHLNDDGFSVSDPVDSYYYSHTVDEDDVANQSLPNIPAYSSDFSNEPFVVYLDASGANRILVTMDSKIEFNGQGCNFAINKIRVLQADPSEIQ